MAGHNDTGTQGEELAARFLEEKGYAILERNWRYKNLEADLIAREKNVIIVAEVKTRHTNFFGEPEEFVNKKKRTNLIKAANAYLDQKGLENEVRFDIISVLYKGQKVHINHIEDAFYPTL